MMSRFGMKNNSLSRASILCRGSTRRDLAPQAAPYGNTARVGRAPLLPQQWLNNSNNISNGSCTAALSPSAASAIPSSSPIIGGSFHAAEPQHAAKTNAHTTGCLDGPFSFCYKPATSNELFLPLVSKLSSSCDYPATLVSNFSHSFEECRQNFAESAEDPMMQDGPIHFLSSWSIFFVAVALFLASYQGAQAREVRESADRRLLLAAGGRSSSSEDLGGGWLSESRTTHTPVGI